MRANGHVLTTLARSKYATDPSKSKTMAVPRNWRYSGVVATYIHPSRAMRAGMGYSHML